MGAAKKSETIPLDCPFQDPIFACSIIERIVSEELKLMDTGRNYTQAEIDNHRVCFDGDDKTPRLELIDVARELGVTIDVVRDLALKKKIGHFRCGKKITISELQFAEYKLSLPKEVEVKAHIVSQNKPVSSNQSRPKLETAALWR
jgi:hypothetical protein